MDHYLSPYLERDLGEVVVAVITGQDKQIIVVWWVVCLIGLCCFLGVVSVPRHKDFLSFLRTEVITK
jgi:hypothetical protein